jgi:phosphoglycolate phosphatase-like HAD superfamily hydrolase
MTKYQGIIFDVDGVILDSLAHIYGGVHAVFLCAGKIPPSFCEFYRTYETPFVDYYHRRGVTLSTKEIWQVYGEGETKGTPKVFAGFKDFLHRLFLKSRPKLFIVSANEERNILAALACENLAPMFDQIWAGRENKVSAIQEVVRSLGCQPKNVVYIGDMRSDMRDGKLAGVTCVGLDLLRVGTEWSLLDAGADFCFFSYEDLFLFGTLDRNECPDWRV